MLTLPFGVWSVKMSAYLLFSVSGSLVTLLAAQADTTAAVASGVVGVLGAGGFLWKFLQDHRAIERERETARATLEETRSDRDEANRQLEVARTLNAETNRRLSELQSQMTLLQYKYEHEVHE